ncbi:MAG: helix-turn-helix transcriptional regulator [Actinomycetota bacterium]|nr:helix-turn-helix transcriptional regulator [Actinomycetota bacterium]
MRTSDQTFARAPRSSNDYDGLCQECGRRREARTGTQDGQFVIGALTSRELEVALFATDGATSVEIASRLGISRRTVETHLQRVYDKLGVHTRTHLSLLVRAVLSRNARLATTEGRDA